MEIIKEIFKTILEILKVKNLIPILLTVALVLMLTGKFNPSEEFITVFCTAYGSIITYYFSNKDD